MIQDIYEILRQRNIPYQRLDHPPVFTCEEAFEHIPDSFPGIGLKNLFLRDKKGARHILLVVEENKQVDLKAFGDKTGSGRLSFASPQRLQTYLGVAPGSATILGLVNDTEKMVEIFLDREVAESESLQCHPLINTSSLSLRLSDIFRFLEHYGYTAQILDIPVK